MERTVGTALIAAQNPYGFEPDLCIAADRTDVLGGRVDGEMVVSSRIDEVSCEGPKGVDRDSRAVPACPNGDVNGRRPVVRIFLFCSLDDPGELVIVDDDRVDRLAGLFAADEFVSYSGSIEPRPPASHLRLGHDLLDVAKVAVVDRAQHDTLSGENHASHDGSIPFA